MTKTKKDTLPALPPDDTQSIRCARLGHQINFTYCQSENSGQPCFKTLDCWFNYFDVHAYFEKKLSKEEFESIFLNKGRPKVMSLVELIERAKKRQGKDK